MKKLPMMLDSVSIDGGCLNRADFVISGEVKRLKLSLMYVAVAGKKKRKKTIVVPGFIKT